MQAALLPSALAEKVDTHMSVTILSPRWCGLPSGREDGRGWGWSIVYSIAIFLSLFGVYIYIYIYICLSFSLSIYISIEREMDMDIDMDVYMYIYIYIYMFCLRRRWSCSSWRTQLGQIAPTPPRCGTAFLMCYVGDWKRSCDVMTFGSFPIRWLFVDMRSFKYNHLMRKLVGNNHSTW